MVWKFTQKKPRLNRAGVDECRARGMESHRASGTSSLKRFGRPKRGFLVATSARILDPRELPGSGSRATRSIDRALPRAACALVLAAACRALPENPETVPVVRGPLPTRTQHPLALIFPGMTPRRATTVEPGQNEALVTLAYSSIFEVNGKAGDRVAFDGELARGSVRIRHGLDAESDLEVEIAAIYATSGFLDAFVQDFHQSTRFADGGRSEVENDQFAMFLREDGERIFEVEEDRVSLADLPIVWTRRIVHEGEGVPAVALRACLELPTGSFERGAGNEKVDYAAGALAEKSFERWTVTGSVDWIFTQRPSSFVGTGVDVSDLLVLQNGWEYRWTEHTSLLAQLSWTSPMTDDFDFEEINREILDVGVGFSHDLGKGVRWLASFHEDAVAATGPDFTLFTGLDLGF
jgi:hypothetical protein